MRRDLEGNEGKVMGDLEEGKRREVEGRKREDLNDGEGKVENLEEVKIEEAMEEEEEGKEKCKTLERKTERREEKVKS